MAGKFNKTKAYETAKRKLKDYIDRREKLGFGMWYERSKLYNDVAAYKYVSYLESQGLKL